MAIENSPAETNHSGQRPHRRAAAGSSPGTLIVAPGAAKTIIELIAFGPDHFERRALTTEELTSFATSHPVTWINITGTSILLHP